MPWSEILPQFSLTGTLLTVLLLFFAAVGEPLLGRRAFSWLSRREGDGRALELLYAVTMGVHILWGVLVLAVVLTSPELHPVDLGLRFPDAWGPIVGGALGGLVALLAFWLLVNGMPTKERFPALGKLPALGKRNRKKGSGDDASEESRGRRGHRGHRGRRAPAKPMTLPDPGRRQYLLLPRTTKERALAAGMAVTGGVFAELLYRGLFIVLVASMDVPLWIAAVLSVVLFSLAHLYQGWWGLVSAGFSGTLFTILYLGTGSLVVPILVHVALNLRSIVFPPASELAKADEYAAYEDDYYDDECEEGYTGEFEAVEGAAEPQEATGVTPGQGPPAGTPPFGNPGPLGAPAPQGPPPGVPGNPYGAPSHQEPWPGRPGPPQPPLPPQQPQQPQPPYRQGPPPSTPYGAPPPPPGHVPGDFLSDDPTPYPGAGRDQDGRRLHPDEWIDRRYRPGDDTPGSGPTGR
ncbi:CPBP family intramembrane glutamic endopeptidase [Nocardiopsis sp. NPDC006832]|uniref:CPBP family intramembrane glutamic endopeptidase n=1 Tax=Nocardiopsis sp. NPDC006832 TaxID=3157188 RepID=UPI0033FEF1B3